MNITVDRFAELFGIERNTAYGILRFLSDSKLVQTSKQAQPVGADGKRLKGKPATLYYLDDGLGERLVAHLKQHLGQLTVDAPVFASAVVVHDTLNGQPLNSDGLTPSEVGQ